MNKNQILKAAGEYADKYEKENGFTTHPKTASFHGYIAGFDDAKLATDGREELEKEVDFWKRECAAYKDGCQNRDFQISSLKEFEAVSMAQKIILDDYTEQIRQILKCLPKDFHKDISLPARIMNLWQYYKADENKIKPLTEANELLLAKDEELCELYEKLQSSLKEKEKECKVWKQSNSGAVELYKKSLKREHEKYKELEELKAENERLKGFIETAYKSGWQEMNAEQPRKFQFGEGQMIRDLEKFKTENQL